MCNCKFGVVTEEKDLGVGISQDLKASQQCLQAYSKANKVLGVLNRTVKHKDTANLLCFYKPLIRGMTKYRKGPQRTAKEHYTGPQRIVNHERTARLATILFNFFTNYFVYFL